MKNLHLVLLGTVLVGCGGSPEPKVVQAQPTVAAPSDVQSEKFKLVFNDKLLKLGSRLEELKADLPAPEGSNLVRLPAIFRAPYEGFGWSQAGRGFGLIAYNGLIVAAMIVDERGSEDEVVQKYTTLKELDVQEKRIAVTGKKAGYWFLTDGPTQYVLVSVSLGGKERRTVEAIGDVVVLRALRLDAGNARIDVQMADRTVP